MTTANKLTILRVVLIPVFLLALLLPFPGHKWLALAVFVLASATDYLDGHIARSRSLVTDFGRFLDPVADKLLVLSAMVMLCHLGLLPGWAVVIVLARELSVDGLRLIAVTKGKVIAAAKLGKWKTFIQMLLVLFLMIFRIPVFSHWTGIVLFTAAIGLTIVSGVEYFRKNRSLFESR